MLTDNEFYNEFVKSKVESAEIQEVMIPTFIQKRRNKNKRIDKKWLKKYGLRMILSKRKTKVVEFKPEDYPVGMFRPDSVITFKIK